MQVGECLGVGEPGRFWHEAFNQREDSVSTVDETFDDFVPINSSSFRSSLIEPGLGPCGFFGGWQEQEGQVVGALEMLPRFLELGSAFGVDQSRYGIGECAVRIICAQGCDWLRRRLPIPTPAGAMHC